MHAQVPAEPTRDALFKPSSANATNIKVIKEVTDNKGNLVRTIQYDEGKNRKTETIIVPLKTMAINKVAINPDTLNKDSLMIVVNKGKNNLELYYCRHMVRSYKAVFGPKPLEDKKQEGDRCTPEGWYKIANKNPNSKYNKFMLLDYPNDSTRARFSRLQSMGKIPPNAKIGGNVGIHGIWKGGDDMIALGVGWTDGCIAINNADMDDLFNLVSVGTRVYIRK